MIGIGEAALDKSTANAETAIVVATSLPIIALRSAQPLYTAGPHRADNTRLPLFALHRGTRMCNVEATEAEGFSLLRKGRVSTLCLALLGMCTAALVAQRGAGPAPVPPVQTPAGRGEASPASQRPPQTKTPQSFPRDQVEAGRTQFVSQCGFCHGRDAAGGAGGPDLTRSVLVAEDVRGGRLGPFIRSGRAGRGMAAVG